MPIFKLVIDNPSSRTINGRRPLNPSNARQVIYWKAINVTDINANDVEEIARTLFPNGYIVFDIKEVTDPTTLKLIELNKETIYTNNKG